MPHRCRSLVPALLIAGCLASSVPSHAASLTPRAGAHPARSTSPAFFDDTQRFDGNNLGCFVTNFGSFGLDWATPIPLPEQTLVLGLGAGKVMPVWDGKSFQPVTQAQRHSRQPASGAIYNPCRWMCSSS